MKYLLVLSEKELNHLIAVCEGQIRAIEHKLSRTPLTVYASVKQNREYALLKYKLEELKALKTKLLSTKARGSIT